MVQYSDGSNMKPDNTCPGVNTVLLLSNTRSIFPDTCAQENSSHLQPHHHGLSCLGCCFPWLLCWSLGPGVWCHKIESLPFYHDPSVQPNAHSVVWTSVAPCLLNSRVGCIQHYYPGRPVIGSRGSCTAVGNGFSMWFWVSRMIGVDCPSFRTPP